MKDESSLMMEWFRLWELDGDVCRCRKCGRGVIIGRSDEALRHAAFCKNDNKKFPWLNLRKILEGCKKPKPSAEGRGV